MPKQKLKPLNPDDEPAVRAALITGKRMIIVAVIAGFATVIAAIIGLAGKWNEKPPVTEKEKLIVKVVDKTNGKAIGNAKVNLEASGVFAVNSTDSEGVISFPIAEPKKELRLRVEADGYEQNFNLRVTPADIVGAQEIRMTPIAKPSPTMTPTVSSPQTNAATPVAVSSIVRGQVIDESGAPVSGAEVNVTGYVSAVTTNESGNFEISLFVGKGKRIYLHIAKDGFRTRTQEHIINNDSVRILLRR